MNKLQFRILYREFLFRLMDAEVLSQSARGDSNELLGQFGSLLISASLPFTLLAIGLASGRNPSPEQALAGQWSAFHLMLSSTMLAVGLFAVLGWDSTFLDRRDVMVLTPLPVRGRTMFLAKIAAVAVGLGITIVALNWAPGTVLPLAMGIRLGFFGFLRLFVVYWLVLAAGGAFIYCMMLGVQGVIAQLPRRWFLRLSSWLQIGSFALLLAVYFLQPRLMTPHALSAAANQRILAWLPPYWFLGLFSEWSGGFAPGHAVMAPLATRALASLAIGITVAGIVFLLSYLRTLRKIVEEPDILPTARGGTWLPRFGNLRHTAMVQFAIRTLLRSRRHRMILAFYLGFAFAIVALYVKGMIQGRQFLKGTDPYLNVNPEMLVSSVVVLVAWLLGTRVVFSMPLDLRANWVFRVTPVLGGPAILPATRRSLLTLSVAPVLIGCAAIFLWMWPWRPAAIHLVALALLASILADICLFGFRKIPFTCSYLPGKSRVHLTFWFCSLMILSLIQLAINWEIRALKTPFGVVAILAGLGLLAVSARVWTNIRSREDTEVQWEESHSDETIVLGLSS
jgi:hypothetical protein